MVEVEADDDLLDLTLRKDTAPAPPAAARQPQQPPGTASPSKASAANSSKAAEERGEKRGGRARGWPRGIIMDIRLFACPLLLLLLTDVHGACGGSVGGWSLGLHYYKWKPPSDAKAKRMSQALLRRLVELFPQLDGKVDEHALVGPFRAGGRGARTHPWREGGRPSPAPSCC